jgi:hypothetical protein
MNVLAVIATFVLGYHYLIDVAGGALLAWASIAVWNTKPVQDEHRHLSFDLETVIGFPSSAMSQHVDSH